MKREIIRNCYGQNTQLTVLAERFKWHNFNCCQVQTKKRDEKYHQFIFTCHRPVAPLGLWFFGSTCVLSVGTTRACYGDFLNFLLSHQSLFLSLELSRVSQSVNMT